MQRKNNKVERQVRDRELTPQNDPGKLYHQFYGFLDAGRER